MVPVAADGGAASWPSERVDPGVLNAPPPSGKENLVARILIACQLTEGARVFNLCKCAMHPGTFVDQFTATVTADRTGAAFPRHPKHDNATMHF
jgi:hypothetical protein